MTLAPVTMPIDWTNSRQWDCNAANGLILPSLCDPFHTRFRESLFFIATPKIVTTSPNRNGMRQPMPRVHLGPRESGPAIQPCWKAGFPSSFLWWQGCSGDPDAREGTLQTHTPWTRVLPSSGKSLRKAHQDQQARRQDSNTLMSGQEAYATA